MKDVAVRSGPVLFLLIAVCCNSAPSVPDRGDKGTTADPAPRTIDDEGIPYFGFTPFPYNYNLEAINWTRDAVAANSTVYALHFDEGVPWEEALNNKPFPREMQNEWDRLAREAPAGVPVYLGLAPLKDDRVSLANAVKGSSVPGSIQGARLDSDPVKRAFLNYTLRAIRQFRPRYLNIGIEAGEMAARDPGRWPQFEAFFDYMKNGVHTEYPKISIGISFNLQSLMDDPVAQRARALVQNSDYLGLSFYPSASPFSERFGASPLPGGVDQWRVPLQWASEYTDRPVAICETGYLSEDVYVPQFDLALQGDAQKQAAYVRDLVRTAKEKDYLFVVWFLIADYDQLYAGMPPGSEVFLLWRDIGFYEGDLSPKPALKVWQDEMAREEALEKPGDPLPEPTATPAGGREFTLDFADQSGLFTAPPPDQVTYVAPAGSDPGAMKWAFGYKKGEWKWAVRDVAPGSLKGMSRFRFQVKAQQNTNLFVQLTESDGEPYFVVLPVTTEWQTVTQKMNALTLDAKKKKNGKLDKERIGKILLADPSAQDGATGNQAIWIANWVFE